MVETKNFSYYAFKPVVRICGLVVALIGTGALVGWLTEWHVLTGLRSDYIPMAPNTAFCFLILGILLYLIVGGQSWRFWSARLGATLVLILVTLRLSEYIAGIDFAVDRWILKVPNETLGLAPIGKMAFFTAINFLFASISFLLMTFPARSRFANYGAAALAVGVAFIGLVFSLGYLYKAPLLYGGEDIPMALNTAVAFCALGTGLILISLSSEILRLKQAEEWRQSESSLTKLFEYAPDAIILVDITGKIQKANPQAEKIFGYSPSELVGKPVAALIPQHHREHHQRQCSHYFSQPYTRVMGSGLKLHGSRKDGSEFPVDISLAPVTMGTDTYVIGVVRDISERRQAEETLLKSEEKYRTLVNELNDGIFVTDQNGVITFANLALSTIHGLGGPKELVGRNFMEFILPERLEEIKQHFNSFTKAPANFPQIITVSITRPDGKNAIVEVKPTLILDGNNVVGTRGVVRDITGRRQAEVALRESEERFRVFMDNSPAVSWVKDENGRFTYINQQFEKLFNVKKEEIKGKTDFDYFSDEVARQNRANDMTVLSSKKPLNIVEIVPTADGKQRHWLVSKFPFQNQLGAKFVGGMAFDITERKQAEEKLENSLSVLRGTLDSTADGILVVSQDGKIVTYNQKFKAMWGISDSIMASGDDNQALASVLDQLKDPDEFIAKVRELYNQPEAESYDLLEFKDGRIFERYSQPQRTGGKSVGRVWSFRNVTEQKRLEEQFRQSQKLEAVGRLAGGVAHDFNNLLTVMMGYSEILLTRLEESNPLRKEVEAIGKSVVKAASLTQQLLAFSRKQVLQPKLLNLNTVAAEIDKMLGRLINENIDLVTVTCPKLGSVMADPNQIEQVIMNLVVNSRDAMPDGGKITIETANVYLDENYANGHPSVKPGPYVMLAVSDTGCGMDQNTISRIFEPFFTTKESGKGTGLGLSTVYGIVKQSAGYVWAYSEPGKGTTFKIYLPLVEGTPETDSRGQRPEVESLQGVETILLVEDDESVRKLACRILAEKGYNVLAPHNPAQAIEICQSSKTPINLLITDMVMPQMSGIGLAQRLQQLHPGIQVLYMSGYTDTSVLRQGLLDSNTPFIQKPFTPESLARKVREALSLPQVQPELVQQV